MGNSIQKYNTNILNLIFTVRGKQMMIDRDLVELYGVSTKVLNQAVKRNIERLPETFRFQLNETEKLELVTNCDRFEKLKHSSVNPYAFNGQVFDALACVSDLVKSAESNLILIVQKEVYHIGASLKDLGKKWFAFSKMEKDSLTILKKLGIR